MTVYALIHTLVGGSPSATGGGGGVMAGTSGGTDNALDLDDGGKKVGGRARSSRGRKKGWERQSCSRRLPCWRVASVDLDVAASPVAVYGWG
jgi:hypothetical protein